MDFGCEEKQWGQQGDKDGPFTFWFVIDSLVSDKPGMLLSVEVQEPPMC